MKQTKIFNSTIVAFLIAAMIVGIPSCSKKEPEPVLSVELIMGKWYRNMVSEGCSYEFEFKTDGTYSYLTENELINGYYRIIESKKATYVFGDSVEDDSYLFKMLVSGSSIFDQLWVYRIQRRVIGVEIYSSNELVQNIGFFIDYPH